MRRVEAGLQRGGADIALGNMLADIQEELLAQYGQPQHLSFLGLLATGGPDSTSFVPPRQCPPVSKRKRRDKPLKRSRTTEVQFEAEDGLPLSSSSCGRYFAAGCQEEGGEKSTEAHSQKSNTLHDWCSRLSRAPRMPRMEGAALVHWTQDDWACALHPMGELGPYLKSTSAPFSGLVHGAQPATPAVPGLQPTTETSGLETTSGDQGDAGAPTVKHSATANDVLVSPQFDPAVVVNYVKCRCAELPMRLRLEALQMRRHEHLLRQHMQELIRFSEFLTLCGAVPSGATWENTTGGSAGSNSSGPSKASLCPFAKASSLPPGYMDAAKRDGVEGLQLLSRCFQRVAELERLVTLDSTNKVLCAERMVLLSATTLAAARRVDLNI
ncbi:unnamed protein product [Phytomonas sp. EM1]|nr:unnamed protein product [Phytomonas sp. EM1]|eukprot:CCW64900.1 unnamed protein product [Phytomonas sp. isolate EM1]